MPQTETKPEDSAPGRSSESAEGITRREVIEKGGKIAAAAAVSSIFAPFIYTAKAAAAKTLTFWQFYAPGGGSAVQAKWFEDMVKSWNDTHEVKVELVYVPGLHHVLEPFGL